MTYHKFTFSLILLMLMKWSTPVFAVDLIDTTTKSKILPLGGMPLQTVDYLSYFKEGIELLKENSLSKGISLISTGIQKLDAESKFTRCMPYQSYELISIVNEVNANKLNSSEKELGQMFIKNLFTVEPEEAEKNLAPYFKKAANTVFSKRLRLLVWHSLKNKKADALLDALLKSTPELVTANILKAEQCYDDEKYDQCVTYSTKVLSYMPNYAHAYHIRAKSHADLKQYEKAIADYDSAIKLAPTMLVFTYDRADALLDMKKYNEAITGFKVFITSQYKWTFYNIARSYKSLKKLDSALYYIEEHIKQYPDDEDGYNIKGDIFAANRDYEKAISTYTIGLKFAPKDDGLYADRADAYFLNHQYNEAVKDYLQAVEIDSRPYRLDRLGICYYYLNDYEKSVIFHNKALKVNPQYKYSYWSLNLTYNKMQKYTDAIVAGHKAIAIDSTYAGALGNLGWSYYCAGDNKNCIEYSYKALKYEPSASYAMFNIGLATLRNGDFEKAKERYRAFIEECHQKNYKINDGAIEDLKDLIKKNIMAKEATYIIEEIFKAKI